jgi:type IV pilus assembly PilX-like protein
MRESKMKSNVKDEAGVALIITLMALLLMSAFGAGLLLMTAAETRIAASFRDSQAALYAADAGIERALDDLLIVPDWNPLLDGSTFSSFVDGAPSGRRRLDDGSDIDLGQLVNVANCHHVAPCSAAEMDAVSETRPWGPNNPRWTLFAYGRVRDLLPPGAIDSPFYVVVMIGDDPAENDNDPIHDGAVGNPGAGAVAVRAEAFGPGGTHRVVEATVARAHGAIRALSWRETHQA